MGLEFLLIIIVLSVTRSMPLSRLSKAMLVIGYFLAVILTWSVTWQIPYHPNALLIDTVSLGLPFVLWLFCLLLLKRLTK